MRLINTKTGRFEEFPSSKTIPFYAILSHTWGKKEQTYQEVVKIQENFGLSSSPGGQDPVSNIHVTSAKKDVRDTSQSAPVAPTVESAHQAREETSPLPDPSIPGDTEPPSEVEAARPSTTCLSTIWDPESGLSEKIRKACEVARQDGYLYIWIDSSCIDKTSSSELSEAINSMFNWYRDAQICYAFLSDVPSGENVREEDPDRYFPEHIAVHHQRSDSNNSQRKEEISKRSKFCKSRWFWRAWTLQELIAPRMVVFLSQEWKGIGTKHSLSDLVEEVTHINQDILTHKKALTDETVANRMRWAAERDATRVEDQAYSLLGIFGVTIPTLYGEGENAFRRLQEEILQRIPDRSLFAWGNCRPLPLSKHYIQCHDFISPLATSPSFFANDGEDISAIDTGDFQSQKNLVEEYTLTPHGIRTTFSLIPIKSLAPSLEIYNSDVDTDLWHLFVLSYEEAPDGQLNLLGKLCTITRSSANVNMLNVPQRVAWQAEQDGNGIADRSIIFTVLLKGAKNVYTQYLTKPITVYLPHTTPYLGAREPPAGNQKDIPQSTTLSFSPWALHHLLPPPYTISVDSADDHNIQRDYSSSLSLALSDDQNTANLRIQYRHMRTNSSYGEEMGDFGAVIEARIWVLSSDLTFDNSIPPFTSAIWAADTRHSTLPRKDVYVIVQSGAELILRLWLGIAQYGHYHAHIEVTSRRQPTPDVGTDHPGFVHALSTRKSDFPVLYPKITETHKSLKFTMLGSVQRALESQGYSIHLERSVAGTQPNSHSLTLTLSNVDSGLIVTIKYFYFLSEPTSDGYQELIFVWRVSLESISARSHGTERYQDGPYVWRTIDDCGLDGRGWDWSTFSKTTSLTTTTGNLLELTLSLDLAWVSEYYLAVGIEHGENANSSSFGCKDGSDVEMRSWLANAYDRINLTLPSQDKRALQMHGYEVDFQGPVEDDSPYPHHLVLSSPILTIDIETSHQLYIGPDRQQGLTFRVCITTPASQGLQKAATQPTVHILEWDAWQPKTSDGKEGWRWTLPQKDVELDLPNGLKLILRLGFYLVWLGEYCITVEVIPQPQPSLSLSPSPAHSNSISRSSYTTSPQHACNALAGDRREEAKEENASSAVAALVASEPVLDVEQTKAEEMDPASTTQDE